MESFRERARTAGVALPSAPRVRVVGIRAPGLKRGFLLSSVYGLGASLIWLGCAVFIWVPVALLLSKALGYRSLGLLLWLAAILTIPLVVLFTRL